MQTSVLPPFDTRHRFVIFSRHMAEHWLVPAPYAVISINDSSESDEPVNFAHPQPGYMALLQLVFDDLTESGQAYSGLRLFEAQQAQAILRFWGQHRARVQRFMIHCQAGLSRSAGVGTALALLEQYPDTYLYQRLHPNVRVKQTLLQEARRLGLY